MASVNIIKVQDLRGHFHMMNVVQGKISKRWYICSAQSKNWYNSRIVLRKVGILTLLRNSRMVTVQF